MHFLPVFIAAASLFWGNPGLTERVGLQQFCSVDNTQVVKVYDPKVLKNDSVELYTYAYAYSPGFAIRYPNGNYPTDWPCRIKIVTWMMSTLSLRNQCTVVLHEYGHSLFAILDQYNDPTRIMFGEGDTITTNPVCRLAVHLIHQSRHHIHHHSQREYSSSYLVSRLRSLYHPI